MDNDKDGDRWRLWCRAIANPGSPVSLEIERRLDTAPRCDGPAGVVVALTVALDEVLELYPEN